MFFKLLLTVVLFAGLLSAQENNGEKIIKPELKHYLIDTTLIEIFSIISKEYDTFLDIAPIPIYDELTDLDNENVDQVFESIREFNDLINNNQKILGSVEQSVISSKDCETVVNYTECTYFIDKGDYSITVKQEITQYPLFTYTYKVYFSGVFEGVDYGSMYLLQDYNFMGEEDNYLSIWEFYQPPSPPWCANQPSLTILYLTDDDGSTTYTPWGTSSSRGSSTIQTTHYVWDLTVDYNRPLVHDKMASDGNKLIFEISVWSYNKEALYLWWIAIWDWESRTGSWTSFDENGIPQNTGPM